MKTYVYDVVKNLEFGHVVSESVFSLRASQILVFQSLGIRKDNYWQIVV